jgi:hypothetical protein
MLIVSNRLITILGLKWLFQAMKNRVAGVLLTFYQLFTRFSSFSGHSLSAKKSPSAAADEKAEGIPGSVVVLGVKGNIKVQQHADKVDGGNDAMPQSAPETICVTCKAIFYHFLMGTGRKKDKQKQSHDDGSGWFLIVWFFHVDIIEMKG